MCLVRLNNEACCNKDTSPEDSQLGHVQSPPCDFACHLPESCAQDCSTEKKSLLALSLAYKQLQRCRTPDTGGKSTTTARSQRLFMV